MLKEYENNYLSTTIFATILEKENILSPRVTKHKKRVVAKSIKEQEQNIVTTFNVGEIEDSVYELEEIHPIRPRKANFGEIIQMVLQYSSGFEMLILNYSSN